MFMQSQENFLSIFKNQAVVIDQMNLKLPIGKLLHAPKNKRERCRGRTASKVCDADGLFWGKFGDRISKGLAVPLKEAQKFCTLKRQEIEEVT
jgi:hypothetical protein